VFHKCRLNLFCLMVIMIMLIAQTFGYTAPGAQPCFLNWGCVVQSATGIGHSHYVHGVLR